MSHYKFVNPYNFIPLEKERAYAQKEEKVYSGVICYSVLTRTPLFIPNTSNDHALYPNELEHKSYEFFSYTDLSNSDNKKQDLPWPVIPGSEMRGMLRNNFEILTNSCMSAIDNEINISTRNGKMKREKKYNLNDFINEHKVCSDKNNLCPACSLFGIIGKSFQVSSHIRVSDLTCDVSNEEAQAEECYDKCVTLKPLATPKLSNTEFYLKRPEDAWFWNYDYYIDKNGNAITKLPEINGRKFYWHQMDVQLEDQEKTKLNISIRPVKKGIKFNGKIFFDKISKTELNQLIYLLNAGDEGPLEDKKHGYKLGTAKPLGLGSIAVSVNKVKWLSYCIDLQARTILRKEKVYNDYVEPIFVETIKKDFAFITDFNAVQGKNVSYPVTGKRDKDGNLDMFDWFKKNRKKCGKQMVFREYMEATKPELVAIEVEEAIVIRRSQSGNLVIKVNERQGTISCKNYNHEEIEQLKKGDQINVRFVREKSYPNGNIAYFYDWIK